jgi:hypothetical protein
MRCVRARGRSPNAPVLRAIMMCRSESASQIASSQSWTDAIVASQIQRICSLADLSVPKAPAARRSMGIAAS